MYQALPLLSGKSLQTKLLFPHHLLYPVKLFVYWAGPFCAYQSHTRVYTVLRGLGINTLLCITIRMYN